MPLLLAIVIVGQLMVGCSTMSGMVTSLALSSSLPALQTITLITDRFSNNGAPVAVDLVLLLDKKPLAVLGALQAGEWFKNRHDLQREYSNQVQVTSWEAVPGQVIKLTKIPGDQGKLMGVLIYANYPGEKNFRADVSRMPNVRVNLHKDNFSISQI